MHYRYVPVLVTGYPVSLDEIFSTSVGNKRLIFKSLAHLIIYANCQHNCKKNNLPESP